MTKSGTVVGTPPTKFGRPQGFWRDSAASWSKWDVVLIAAVVAGSVGWILLNLRAIGYGDPVTHCARLNSLLAGDPFDVANYHEARFGLEGPAFVARLLLGDHPNIYYIAPLVAFAVLAVTTYVLGSRIFDRRVGLVAVGASRFSPSRCGRPASYCQVASKLRSCSYRPISCSPARNPIGDGSA